MVKPTSVVVPLPLPLPLRLPLRLSLAPTPWLRTNARVAPAATQPAMPKMSTLSVSNPNTYLVFYPTVAWYMAIGEQNVWSCVGFSVCVCLSGTRFFVRDWLNLWCKLICFDPMAGLRWPGSEADATTDARGLTTVNLFAKHELEMMPTALVTV